LHKVHSLNWLDSSEQPPLKKIGNEITPDTEFTLSIPLKEEQQYVRVFILNGQDLQDNPDIPVILRPLKNNDDVYPFLWNFIPTNNAQISKQDNILHYGIPFGILRIHVRHLDVDKSQQFVTVAVNYGSDISDKEWIAFPTFPIHVCFDKNSRRCHYLEGTHTSQSMMQCQYSNKNILELECTDDVGHRIFQSEKECQESCFEPTYLCSQSPLFQCKLNYDLNASKAGFASFDDCFTKCRPETDINNTDTAVKETETEAAKEKGKWVWIWALLSIVLSLSIISVSAYHQWKKK